MNILYRNVLEIKILDDRKGTVARTLRATVPFLIYSCLVVCFNVCPFHLFPHPLILQGKFPFYQDQAKYGKYDAYDIKSFIIQSKGYFKEVGKYAAKDIEYDMQQDGVFNTVSVFAYPSEEQSKDKCIDALDYVHMDHTKKQCLQNVCTPERKSFSGKTVSQSTESQFFSNRRQQDDIQVCQSGGI